MNLADAQLIGALPNVDGKPLGDALGKDMVGARSRVSRTGFTDLKQLLAVPGMDEATVKELVRRFGMPERHKGLLKSRTLFTFAKEAPKLEGYAGEVILEKVAGMLVDEKGNPLPAGDETTYEVYYASTVDKDQLFKALEAHQNFRGNSQQRAFAIQTRNNQFVATPVPNFSVYLREIYFASKFTIATANAHPHPPYGPYFPFLQTNKPNAYYSVALKTNFYGNVGLLSFNSAQNRVYAKHSTTAGSTEMFDISGIISEPWPGAHPMFKNFTLMNFVQSNITAADPREFITADNAAVQPGSQNGLQGSNNNTEGWRREFQFRYVEVVEDILLESVQNPSHAGSGRWYVNCKSDTSNGYAAQINAIQVLPGAAVPDSARFDMFVFYGYWEERGNIVCRVAFRSKQSGSFLGLKANGLGIHEDLNALHTSLNDATSFYVENGWGGTVNNVNLKTSTGKYVLCWQNVVVADSASPINHEQFKVIIP